MSADLDPVDALDQRRALLAAARGNRPDIFAPGGFNSPERRAARAGRKLPDRAAEVAQYCREARNALRSIAFDLADINPFLDEPGSPNHTLAQHIPLTIAALDRTLLHLANVTFHGYSSQVGSSDATDTTQPTHPGGAA